MLGFKRRSLNKLQSPRSNTIAMSVNDASEKVVADAAKVESSSNSTGLIQTDNLHENESKETLQPIQSVTTTKFAEPKKIEKKPAQQSTCYSGVTIRKKMNSTATTLSAHSNRFDNNLSLRSPGTTCLPLIIRPKINFVKNSTGILKPSQSPNLHFDKKVKFDDGSVARKNMEKPSSERKAEKVDKVPKTAIKKRIFISSKKTNQ